MEEDHVKMLAFLSKIVYKLSTGMTVTQNEIQSMQNIVDELGSYDLDENEFRY